MENPAPQYPPVEQPKKFPTGLVIGIVAIVLCCCCVILVLVGLTLMGPVVSNVFSTINQDLENPGMPNLPDVPAVPSMTEIPGMPTLSPDAVPQGGRGSDLLRADTWAQVLLAVMLKDPTGCTAPSAAETAISITQEPDSSGVWQEQWVVACGEGKTVPVDITFTPNPNGGTDIGITLNK
jgi:hypothetical protein